MGPRAGLDDLEKRKFLTLPGLELRPLGRPARSQSLYRLRYLGCLLSGVLKFNFHGSCIFCAPPRSLPCNVTARGESKEPALTT
jgi:hypothetical protein